MKRYKGKYKGKKVEIGKACCDGWWVELNDV